MSDIYDLVIIGGGPAGLTAGLYSARARMKTLLLEKTFCGGQMLIADHIENYPGFKAGHKGPDLAEAMLQQAEQFGLQVKTAEAIQVTHKKGEKESFVIILNDREEVRALSLIIATGAKWNALKIPGEEKLLGRGVSFCATCDGPLFRNKDVVVIGGGDTAVGEAMFLAKFASSVTVIHRRDKLRATKILQERAKANPRVKFQMNSAPLEILGTNTVEGIRIKDVATGHESIIKTSGVFVLIGLKPNSEPFGHLVKLDDNGYVVADDDMKTSVEGIFVCGDVRQKTLRQVVTAAGDGATAAVSAEHYVDRLKGTEYK